jgi:hypothetical protein
MVSNSNKHNIMKLRTCFSISILFMAGVVLTLRTVISQSFFAQATNSNTVSNNSMDVSHRFSVEYNKSIPFIKADGPHWKVNVTTIASPGTKPIDNVTYVINLNPGMKNGVQVITSTESRNNFELDFPDLYAGINLNTTAHYTDGRIITQPLQIQLACSQEKCGSQLNVTPSLIGTNIVKVNGNATAKYGTYITNISVNWGDGTKPLFWPNNSPSTSKQFSFSHRYYVIGSYLITIRVTNTRGYEMTQNVTTTGLLYQRYLPSDSSLRVSESARIHHLWREHQKIIDDAEIDRFFHKCEAYLK